MNRLLSFLLPVNFLGMCGFWCVWLTRPDRPLTWELGLHIATEFLTGILALAAFWQLRQRRVGPFFHFALGMLFYASLQATGWAYQNGMWPLLILMLLNVIVVAVYFVRFAVNRPIRA